MKYRFTKSILSAVLVFASLPLFMAAKGCATQTKQQTDTEILQIASVALSTGFAVAGDPSGAAKYTGLMNVLIGDVQNFVPGTSTQNADQAANDVLNYLSAYDPNSKLASEIAIVANGVLQIINDIPGATTTGPAPALQSHIILASGGQSPPQTAAEFKTQWNAALAANPVAGLKPLK